MKESINKIILAYSGGLDTSVILHYLKAKYQCEVIAFIADLGQEENLDLIAERAEKTGASKVYVEDLREEFVRDFVFPMLRANALYEGFYLLGTSIARPLIAKKQIEIAEKEGAQAVAHGATGKGNDQVRFELTYYALNPQIKVIAPWREWEFNGRKDLIKYAKEKKIAIPITEDKPYSIDRNLLHTSYEGGILEDPWMEPPEDMFQVTQSPQKAPEHSLYLEVTYERGDPVAVDGQKMKPGELLSYLNRVGSQFGIGRADVVENRYVGIKSRGVYETPGGTILYYAHRAIEGLTLDREVLHLRDSLIPKYSELVYYGYWFSPERELLQKFIDESQKTVSGVVRLKLYKGNVIITGRKSHASLFDKDLASFDKAGGFSQFDSTGFIKINALRLKNFSKIFRGEK